MRDITERKELEQMKADFLAMLTHDIKNPLAVILAYVEILGERLSHVLEGEDRDTLTRIAVSAHQILDLVNNFLLVSSLEAGKLSLSRRPTHVNALLRQVMAQQEGLALTRLVRVELDLDDRLPEIVADAFQLDRVFANLLNNALKYSPKGGTVTIRSRSGPGAIMVSVTDQGPGIAAEKIPLLFGRYTRLQTTVRKDSTGLGLYIVKLIVTAHGGRVEVQAAPGEGATFSVYLPLAER